MNRRVRNRSHGGVGGGRRKAPSYPIIPAGQRAANGFVCVRVPGSLRIASRRERIGGTSAGNAVFAKTGMLCVNRLDSRTPAAPPGAPRLCVIAWGWRNLPGSITTKGLD